MPPGRFCISDLKPWIEARFSRSSGPGGQNVNRVATRTTLLLDFEECRAVADADKSLIRKRLRTRLARDGRLRVVSQRARTQAGNRALAEARLVELLEQATERQKARRRTRPTAGSRERRMREKQRRSDTKQLRRPPRDSRE